MAFSQTKGKVIKVKDGDTVVVLLSDNTQETLRLAEVDCPERGQAFGKNAKQFTSDAVFGKKITFYRTGKDRYKRTVAKIIYDYEKYLSEEIIRAGFGWWYFKASKNFNLQKLQDSAKQIIWVYGPIKMQFRHGNTEKADATAKLVKLNLKQGDIF